MTEHSFTNNTPAKKVFNKQQVLTVIVIFLTALLLNIAWEFAHHVLYVHYRGGNITNLILLQASFFDAGFITLVFSPFLLWTNFKKTWWVPVVFSFFFAVGLERFALETNRWAYQQSMPVVQGLLVIPEMVQ